MDDNLQEFNDPELYDAENRWGPDDDFYLELARQLGGPILDVGCGTGRLTRAIAEAGLHITGVDIAPAMLARARKLSAHLNIEWIEADCRTMMLGQQFRLMTMTSHAWQFLLTEQDQNRFLKRAYAHLRQGGVLAFETRNLQGRSYNTSGNKKHAYSIVDSHGQWIDVSIASTFDSATMVDRLEITKTGRETGHTECSTLRLRYIAATDLLSLLENHGFTIVAQYGDWTKAPLSTSSPEIITICRK